MSFNNSKLKSIFFLCVLLCFTQNEANGKERKERFDSNPFDLRDNGPAWLNFGPGIIEAARSIVLNVREADYVTFSTYIVTSKDEHLQLVKDWLTTRLAGRLNLSLPEPHAAILFETHMLLYSSEQPPTEAILDNDGMPLIYQRTVIKMPGISEHLLVGVPLQKPVLGQPFTSDDLTYLKKYMAFVRTQSTATKPQPLLNGQ